MALVFHDVHGSNVALTNKNTTATRVNAPDNSNGVLFTSRPLKVGETLEVRLDDVSHTIQGAGLEIGFTDVNPKSLSSVPKTATEMDSGRTVMVSGWAVAENGREIDMINYDVHEIQPGEKLGLRLDGASVEILLFGECVSRVDVTKWKDVYGVVDLYGKASMVTITTSAMTLRTSNTLDDTKKEIKSLLEKMAKKNKDEIRKVLVSVKFLDAAYLKYLKARTSKEQAAAYLAKLMGGHIMTIYLKQIIRWGLEDEIHITLYNDIRSVCWNYCDNSHELCKQLGAAGLLAMCTDELRVLQKTYKNSEGQLMTVYTALGIVHNCAKLDENKGLLRKCQFVDAAQPYTDTDKNAQELVMNAVMAISYVMEENQARIARINTATMETVLERLRRAIDKDTHQYEGWHAYELCHGLANLAADTENLKNAVQSGAHGLFGRLLMNAMDDQDRLAALHALDAHICPISCNVIAEHKGMKQLLMDTKEKKSGSVKETASQVYEKLTSMVKERKKSTPVSATAPPMVQKAPTTPTSPTSPTSPRDPLMELTQAMLGAGDLARHLTLAQKPSGRAAGTCAYRALCTTYFKTLDLHTEFFNPAFDMCYCKDCHSERKDNDYYQRGNPPKTYGLPLGWCRFGLLLPPRAKALGVSKNWHRAFHGTRHKALGSILEVGELAVPGRDILGGDNIKELPGHFCEGYKPDGFNTKQIFLSPSILYSGVDAYAAPVRWSHNSKRYETRVAFQVFVHPTAYKVGPQTIGAKKQLDPKFSNNEIEWFTSQQGSTILYGLLLKIDQK